MTNQYICNNCGYGSVTWYGRCPQCQQWSTLKQVESEYSKTSKTRLRQGYGGQSKIKKASFVKISQVNHAISTRLKTGIYEFDRVLGGGFVSGEVILLTGEPGVGKSTILLKILSQLGTVYVSGEESIDQIKHRIDRLSITSDKISFTNNTQIESVFSSVIDISPKPKVVVFDSIQTLTSAQSTQALGNISQIKEKISAIIDFAKSNKIVIILVGHVTKGGEVAGPKTLEHLVDCVLYLEGETTSQYRVLRATKNRFGSTDEIGLFEMTQKGLVESNNLVTFIDSGKDKNTVGKTIVGIREGSRSFFYEIQCLTSATFLASPRRVVTGVDYNRLQLLLAVANKHLKTNFDRFDVYLNVVGGLTIRSTAADLGILVAAYSSLKNLPVKNNAVFIGEIGLLGEIRPVSGQDKIIAEAKRYKFNPIINSVNINDVKSLDLLRKVIFE